MTPWPDDAGLRRTATVQEEAHQPDGQRPGLPGLELHFPTGVDLPEGLHRQPAEPLLRDHELGAVPPPPGEGEAPRGQGQLHPLSGWSQLLPVHPADHHGHLPDVLLPPHRRPGLERHLYAADLGDVRTAGPEHAQMGRPPHGGLGVPAHGAGLLPRRLQGPAGVQLGHRRHPADPDACCSRSPATCCRGTSWPCGR